MNPSTIVRSLTRGLDRLAGSGMMLPAMSKRTHAYLRVSTDQQGDSGLGLAAQRHAIELAANEDGLAVSVEHEEIASGSDSERPVMLSMIASLRRGDVVIVAASCRLSRSESLAGWIECEIAKRGARLIVASERGVSELERSLRRVINAEERRRIAARTRAALAAKRRRGEKTGGIAPFGFTADDNGKLIPNENEQWIIRSIADLRRDGMSLRAIAAELNARGIGTKTGKAWAPQTVANALTTSTP
jgi:DNA invertase Pin-like site-specific DNA recombinase